MILTFGCDDRLDASSARTQDCLARLFGGEDEVVFVPHLWDPPGKYWRAFRLALIVGQWPLFSARSWRNLRRCVTKGRNKVGVVGLSIGHVKGADSSGLRSLLASSCFFTVRDARSRELMKNDARIYVFPDVTWCYPYCSGGTGGENVDVAINISPCHQRQFDSDGLVEELSRFSLASFPMSFKEEGELGLLRRYFGTAVPSEFSIERLRNARVLIGSTYHAIVFALQIEKPFVALNCSADVERLVGEVGVNDVLLDPSEITRVQAKVDYVLEHRSEVLRRMQSYADQQRRGGEELRRSLHERLGIGT